MKSLKLALLLSLSFASLSQNIFSENARKPAQVDCINCEGSIETSSSSVSSAIKVIEKVVPTKLDNSSLFNEMKNKNKCGEFFVDGPVKFSGRLKNDQKYHVSVDPMFSDIDDSGMAFVMNLPSDGRMSTSKDSKPFLGKTYEGDIMMVEKAFNGKKVVGYNVTISFCKFKMGKKRIIHEKNKIEEMAFGAMDLDEYESCGSYYGINSGRAGFVSNPESAFSRRIPMEKEFNSIDCE